MTSKKLARPTIFDEFPIKGVTFDNRVLRSSVGGRHCTYDGTVTDVWKNFEKRFATGGVGGIISTTFHVNHHRLSPMQYPSIAHPKFIGNLKKYIAEIKRARPGVKYIVQIGDPGYVTYESLFRDEKDALSVSPGFDLAFGYQTWRKPMSEDEIGESIHNHAEAAKRVQEAGADGVEIAAAKGYLIHQFLNPCFNRRKDGWGGTPKNRGRLLREVVTAVRDAVGNRDDFLVGVRLAAADHNLSPPAFAALRWPSPWLQFFSSERRHGNDEKQMIEHAQDIQRYVDYLHIVSGFGFPSSRETPGDFPYDEVKMFFHATHMLTGKTRFRSAAFTLLPTSVLRWALSRGWKYVPAINKDAAARFRQSIQKETAIIVNGGFRERSTIEDALESKSANMVSMARALLANPNLPDLIRNGHDAPNRCSGCNKCVGRTGTSPLGCYDIRRFNYDVRMMYDEILRWNEPDRFEEPAQQQQAQQAEQSEEAPRRPSLELMSAALNPGPPEPRPGA
jgi:2,4-dienoyl-CoA reductase (NADPH2)